jgi:uncharacterized small protein (DUF1192 family)
LQQFLVIWPLATAVNALQATTAEPAEMTDDAISMLNVSATQELAKKGEELEKKVAALEAENDRLKVRADRLATRTEALENENLNLQERQ